MISSISRLHRKPFEIEDHPCADLLGVLPSALREIDKVMKSRPKPRPCLAGVGSPNFSGFCSSSFLRVPGIDVHINLLYFNLYHGFKAPCSLPSSIVA